MKNTAIAIIISASLLSYGCANISPFSPKSNNRINNQQGEIDQIKNNQNGVMADLMNLKNKLDIVARDIENLQQGFINKNNRNYGIQVFHGDGGLIIGLIVTSLLGYLVYRYKIEAIKYKKTAEIIGEEVKKLRNLDVENRIFMSAINNKVEKNTYEVLNPKTNKKNYFF
jgi:hypothetical protein